MKVLHIIPSISERSGGPGQAVLPMCRALRDQGVDVLVASTDAGLEGTERRTEGGGQGKELSANGDDVRTIFLPSQLGQSFKYSRPFAKWLDEHVAEFDVVHIHAVFNHACIAAAPEVIQDGVTGHLVEYGNQQQLAQALINLCPDPAKRQRMGNAGYHRLQEKFTFEHFKNNLTEILNHQLPSRAFECGKSLPVSAAELH